MLGSRTITAFTGDKLLATGRRSDVAQAVKAYQGYSDGGVLVFDDETGSQLDLDTREHLASEPTVESSPDLEKRRAGRPKLGVVSREVTLLPRHWEWLAGQPGGASVTIRKLVEAARRAETDQGARRRAREAADRFMGAMLGNAPNYEEATRALYRGERSRFLELTENWPADPRDHARRLAAGSFEDNLVERAP